MNIQEQIEFLKISGSVLPVGSAEKISDSLEKLEAVYEATIDERRSRVTSDRTWQAEAYNTLTDAIAAVQTSEQELK